MFFVVCLKILQILQSQYFEECNRNQCSIPSTNATNYLTNLRHFKINAKNDHLDVAPSKVQSNLCTATHCFYKCFPCQILSNGTQKKQRYTNTQYLVVVHIQYTEKKKWQNQGKLQRICAKEVQNVFKFFVNEGTKFDFSRIIHDHWHLFDISQRAKHFQQFFSSKKYIPIYICLNYVFIY